MVGYTLLFDSHCSFCCSCRMFISNNTKKNVDIDFLDIKSEKSIDILKRHGVDEHQEGVFNTIYVLQDNVLYSKGDALVVISTYLFFPYSLLYFLSPVIPRFFTHWMYSFLVKMRDRKECRGLKK